MTVAPFILCAYWCASSPVLGALTVPPDQAVVYAAGGVDTTLPTVSLGGVAGVAPNLDLDVRYDTRAGLSHDFGLTARWRFADFWAASLGVSHGFFAIEEIGGIEAADAPYGNGVAMQAGAHGSWFRPGGAHVALGAGLSVRMTELENELGTLSREVSPTLEHVWLEAAVEWAGVGATTFLRLRAAIPVEAEPQVLGYLPWVTVGRTWELR